MILSKVGGGVFGNEHSWIADSIEKAINKYANYDLDIYQFHYRNAESMYCGIKLR